jgi:hypothetical protein
VVVGGNRIVVSRGEVYTIITTTGDLM